jgi:hypothetical protein
MTSTERRRMNSGATVADGCKSHERNRHVMLVAMQLASQCANHHWLELDMADAGAVVGYVDRDVGRSSARHVERFPSPVYHEPQCRHLHAMAAQLVDAPRAQTVSSFERQELAPESPLATPTRSSPSLSSFVVALPSDGSEQRNPDIERLAKLHWARGRL